ncbi:MAG: PIN domain-containing protein [Chloroflexota bacterium]
MAGYVVVLDANILYGIEVTDFFATMAIRRLFRPHWSPQILDEVVRNLASRPDLDPTAIERRVAYLNRALPAALAEAPATLVDAMPVNDKDKHVVALAVHVGAPTIVTENLRDFPAALLDPLGIEAVSADVFALAQVDLHVDGVVASLDAMSARRQRAPKTRGEIIDSLARYLPVTMDAVRRLG